MQCHDAKLKRDTLVPPHGLTDTLPKRGGVQLPAPLLRRDLERLSKLCRGFGHDADRFAA